MFRITRGSHIQHAPAFPSPAFRFPNGTPVPIYAEDDVEAEKQPAAESPRDAGEKPGRPGSSAEGS